MSNKVDGISFRTAKPFEKSPISYATSCEGPSTLCKAAAEGVRGVVIAPFELSPFSTSLSFGVLVCWVGVLVVLALVSLRLLLLLLLLSPTSLTFPLFVLFSQITLCLTRFPSHDHGALHFLLVSPTLLSLSCIPQYLFPSFLPCSYILPCARQGHMGLKEGKESKRGMSLDGVPQHAMASRRIRDGLGHGNRGICS